jgi:regulator of protease activity HflC (stomatin/prohibitin superfamily)
MERSIQKNGLLNLLTLLVVGVAGFAVARYSNSLAGQVGVLFIGVGFLIAAVSWFQMRLEENERAEKLELEEMAKRHDSSALFEGRDAELFPAQRSREQFERFFVPLFTVLLCLLQAGGAFFLWRWLAKPTTTVALKQPMVALALFGLFALVLFLLGKFSATMARLENHRLLRPGAGYMLLGAYLCFIVAMGIVGVQAEFAKADYYIAHVLCGLLALVAVETLINVVLEIYRPRVRGRVGRPLYDSRLVGLLGQPEGLVTTAAQALDYQFGFQVSETWFYRFFERAVGWLLLLQFGVLVLSTCVVVIQPGEQGLLERFGKPVAGRMLLNPGGHLKCPWPIDKVYRFHTDQVQSFTVGSPPAKDAQSQKAVLWTVRHVLQGKEQEFLVANQAQTSGLLTTNLTANNPLLQEDQTSQKTPPVSFLTVSIPVQYQVTNLIDWAYNNAGASNLLQDIATREVVRYLVGADMSELMSSGRMQASQDLLNRIQAQSDKRRLGAKILSVGLQDLHPPVKVAPDYEKVIAAIQTKQAKILDANAYQIQTNVMAQAQSTNIVDTAEGNATNRVTGWLSRAAAFTNQIPAFKASPAVYAQRKYLQTFLAATAGARKYILLTTNTHDVLIFDLQNKIPSDLLGNLTVPSPSTNNVQ